MVVLGIALLLTGIVLLVAEAHVASAGVLGVLGVAGVGAGGWLLLDGAGVATALAVAIAAAVALVALGAVVVGGMKVLAARRRPARGELARFAGRTAEVRAWDGRRGQVALDGALWRARLEPLEEDAPAVGEPVVVAGVEGLTVSVRRCEPWEVE